MKNNHALRHSVLALLLLCGSSAAMAQPGATPAQPALDVTRYAVDGELPLTEAEVQSTLVPFVGPQRSLRDIEAAAAALEGVLRARGYAFHRIFIPAQRPSGGEVRLQVIQFKLGTVEVSGNEHFSPENIRRSLPTLVEGGIPEVRTLGGDVTASNTNPAKQVQVTFKESRQPSTIDAVVRVKDTPPQSFLLSLSGNQSLAGDGAPQNTYRLTGVYQHANLFDRDQVLTLSYTTDPGNISSVSLFGAYYQVPLYGTGLNLSGYITTSDINSGTVQQGAGVFDVSGSGRFMGLRLTKALPRGSSLQQSVSAALDDRLFRNETTFGGVPLQPDVGSRVVSLQYNLREETSWGTWGASLEYAANVGGGSRNTVANHLANGGERDWDAWRYSAEAHLRSGAWQYTGRLRGQYARGPLVAGEQFGLGGAQSVRGFSDRVVAGDMGLQWNFEALGPGLGGWQLRPVLFIEGGQVRSRLTGARETVMGAGAGLRLNVDRLQVSADLAHALDRQSAEPTGRPWRLHLALSYRF